METSNHLHAFGRLCRSVAVGLVARVWPGQDQPSLEARLSRAPLGAQIGVVGGMLALLLLAAFLAAQFGWIGLLVYFVAVVALVG